MDALLGLRCALILSVWRALLACLELLARVTQLSRKLELAPFSRLRSSERNPPLGAPASASSNASATARSFCNVSCRLRAAGAGSCLTVEFAKRSSRQPRRTISCSRSSHFSKCA
jgi:hypothetical protein